MPGREKINTLELLYKGAPAHFVIKTMEEIDAMAGGISDNPHRHNYYTVIWPFSASGKHIIDFREYPIIRDHIFFVSPWQVHQVLADPRPSGYVILFTPEFLDKNSIRNDFVSNLKLFRDTDDTPPLPLEDSMALRLKVFADNMRIAFESRSEMYLEIVGAYLKLFLIECNSHCSLNPGTNLQNIEVSKNIVRNFKDLVEKNHVRWHQVQNYAEALNVTPNYLNEVIKASSGLPAKEFIQSRLVLEAKRLALFTDKSSKEIGFDIGFDDPAHFSKFFKNHSGISVNGFRESISLTSRPASL
ncbi:MAG: helix-turn-helix domain-containing protein [Bacteroidia bacterium]|nr:helix-turn-helix domain-containing protein [Bacteroidia bacterium]